MAERGDPNVLRLVVVFLRFHANMTQVEFGKASRIDQSDISKYELGKQLPPEDRLRRMAAAAGVEWHVVIHLSRFYTAFLSAPADRGAISTSGPLALRVLEPALAAVTPYLVGQKSREPEERTPAEVKRDAERAWAALERFPIARRRRLIELSPPSCRTSALAVQTCGASLRAAAHDAKAALELAELALFIGERVAGKESLRLQVKSYCLGHVGNARRVANDFEGADAAFAQARDLWPAVAVADSEPLPEWRLLSLEASLRRAERRFPEALVLLDRARRAACPDPAAIGRILLKKERTFNQMGDAQSALASLAEASPFIKASGDSHLLFAFSFNTADDFFHLERYAEAAELLPRVQEMAIEQGNQLDLIRVAWLSARVASGLGREEEAVAGLEQVCLDFTDRELPYDAALTSLDLAVLWLKSGRTAEVRELALGMAWIFEVKGIHREALAALSLFCEAARQETATADLARRLGQYLCWARHDPGLRFDIGNDAEVP